MKAQFQRYFQDKWTKYFPAVELPVAYYYTDRVTSDERADSRDEEHCVVASFRRVRQGHTFIHGADSPGCSGWKHCTGSSQSLRPNFEFFLSCGISGELEGERHKKSPELVRSYLEQRPPLEVPGRYLVFKRWDKLAASDLHLAVIFFAPPDVISGLFALATYDRAYLESVITPMGSGCATIVHYPYREAKSEDPPCVLGMFDVSARPQVPSDFMTFTIPFARFEKMVANMDESFLITPSWQRVQQRLPPAAAR